MYYESNNAKAIFSKDSISSALLCLMHNVHYDKITISEICKEADVVRSSFYRNFTSKEDVLMYIFRRKLKETLNYCGDTLGYEFLVRFLNYWKSQADFLQVLEMNQLFPLLMKLLAECIADGNYRTISVIKSKIREEWYEHYYNMVSYTTVSLLETWTKHKFKESVEELIHISLLTSMS